MKKINLLKPFLLFSLLAVLLTLAACNNPVGNTSSNSEPKKYTIWLDRSTYTQFKEVFKNRLEDGDFIQLEFNAEQWNAISKVLPDKDKDMWTESQIMKWLKSEEFGDTEATKQAKWLITHEHVCIVSRTGDIVSYLYKQ
jgi:putative lipoprotein